MSKSPESQGEVCIWHPWGFRAWLGWELRLQEALWRAQGGWQSWRGSLAEAADTTARGGGAHSSNCAASPTSPCSNILSSVTSNPYTSDLCWCQENSQGIQSPFIQEIKQGLGGRMRKRGFGASKEDESLKLQVRPRRPGSRQVGVVQDG